MSVEQGLEVAAPGSGTFRRHLSRPGQEPMNPEDLGQTLRKAPREGLYGIARAVLDARKRSLVDNDTE